MTLNLFPSLPGLGWPATKAPMWRTRTQRTVSGRESRLQDQLVPLWKWTLPFNFLRDGSDTRAGAGIGLGVGFTEAEQLIGFFNQQGGSFLPFLLNDPTDNFVTAQPIGTGDASTVAFQLVRTLGGMLPGGGFTEPVYAPIAAGALVYLNGVLQAGSAYSINTANGMITFVSPPGVGVVITATFSYDWIVRFAQDSNDFDYFLYQVYQAKKIEFQSVLP